MILLAAFSVVLARWSGQRDLLIGSPVAGRSHKDLEPIVGFFVNTLPLRIDASPSARLTFAQLIARVRETCTAAYTYSDLPFEKLVQALGPDRTRGLVPLVRVMLALRDVPGGISLSGLEISEIDIVSQSSKFDLTLDLVRNAGGGLRGRVEFSTDLFAPATAERVGRAFLQVLQSALADPKRPVDRLPLVDAEERKRLLMERSGDGSGAAADTAGCLHQLIDARAASQPERPAVACGGRTLTYRELAERANRLAHHLRSLGTGPERLVGVCLPKSENMVVALLAILKAGAGYVPLDPEYPRQRIAMMTEDSAVSLIITDRHVAGTWLLGGQATLVLVDGPLAATPDGPPPDIATSRTLAYVIYTSGSTGIPKGSANEHGGVVNTMLGLKRLCAYCAALVQQHLDFAQHEGIAFQRG